MREMIYFTFVMLIEQGKKRIGPYRSKPSNYSILKWGGVRCISLTLYANYRSSSRCMSSVLDYPRLQIKYDVESSKTLAKNLQNSNICRINQLDTSGQNVSFQRLKTVLKQNNAILTWYNLHSTVKLKVRSILSRYEFKMYFVVWYVDVFIQLVVLWHTKFILIKELWWRSVSKCWCARPSL